MSVAEKVKENGSVLAICATIVVCVAMGVYGWLALHKIDTQQFMYIFGTTIATNIGLIFNLLQSTKLSKKQDLVQEQVETVVHNTNGTMEKLVNELPQKIEEAVATQLQEVNNADKHNH